MSQSGDIVYYSTKHPNDVQRLIQQLIECLGAQSVLHVWRSRVEDNGWDYFQRDKDLPLDILTGHVVMQDLAQAYVEGRSLSFALLGTAAATHVHRAIEENIPTNIRGDFRPTDLYITIGYHDLWENAEHDEGFFFAKAFLSVHFNGYGTPKDWPAFRRLVFDIPEIQAEKQKLEVVAGPLEQCAYWST